MTQHLGLSLELSGEWSDIKLTFPPVDIEPSTVIYLDVTLAAEQPIAMRLCLLNEDSVSEQAEYWREYEPGRSTIIIRGSKLRSTTARFSGHGVSRLFFGGIGTGTVTLAVAVSDGSRLLIAGA